MATSFSDFDGDDGDDPSNPQLVRGDSGLSAHAHTITLDRDRDLPSSFGLSGSSSRFDVALLNGLTSSAGVGALRIAYPLDAYYGATAELFEGRREAEANARGDEALAAVAGIALHEVGGEKNAADGQQDSGGGGEEADEDWLDSMIDNK